MAQHRRHVRLLRPRLQLRLMASFLGLCLLALTLQAMVFLDMLGELARSLPSDGAVLMTEASERTVWVLALSFGLLLPATFLVGLLVTHRLVGPIYRFEVYLKQVIRGETREPCRIRKGDELHELCDLINRATEPARGVESSAPKSAAHSRPAA